MGLFDRTARLIRANINEIVRKSEDPEQVLEQLVADLQEEIVHLRQTVASAITNQQRSEQQCNRAMQDFGKWHVAARTASDRGDEKSYREAISRAEEYAKTANDIKKNLAKQEEEVKLLKISLVKTEREISEIKSRKDMLKSRLHAAQFQEQQQQVMPIINQMMIDCEQSIDKSEATELYWVEAKSRVQTDLDQVHQTLENAVANQRSLQRQYNQAIRSESDWQQKAQAAAGKGDRDLLAEALARKKTCNKTIAIKKTQLDAQSVIVKLLKQYLILLESQVDECQNNIDTINTAAV